MCPASTPGIHSAAIGIPGPAEDQEDEPAFRQRAEQNTRRHTDAIIESVTELADLGPVDNADPRPRVGFTAGQRRSSSTF
jgi:hypothetical protein